MAPERRESHKHWGARCSFRRSRLRRNTSASTRGSP